MTNKVIEYIEITHNTQIFKIAVFAIKTSDITKISPKNDHSITICSTFCIGMIYKRWYLVNPHVQTVQNMYGKLG